MAISSGRARLDAMSSRIHRRASTASARGEAQETISRDAGVGRASEPTSPVNQAASTIAWIAPSEPHLPRQGNEQWAPNRGDAHDPIKFDRPEDRWRVRHALQGGIAQIARRQNTDRQARTHTSLNRREILEPRALMGVVGQREVGVPQPGQRPSHGARHAGQASDALEFGETAGVERRPDRRVKVLGSGWAREAAGEPRRKLRQGHDLHAGLPLANGGDPPHAEGERPLNDDGPTIHRTPLSPLSLYFVTT